MSPSARTSPHPSLSFLICNCTCYEWTCLTSPPRRSPEEQLLQILCWGPRESPQVRGCHYPCERLAGGSEACAEAPANPRRSRGLIHPGDGCTDPADGRKPGRGRRWLPPCLGRLGLGQPARRLHLGCGCGVRLRREAAPDIPWSPSRQGEGMSPHPGIKSKPPLGLAHMGLPTLLLSVCPAQPN